jgi:uncharacterized protein
MLKGGERRTILRHDLRRWIVRPSQFNLITEHAPTGDTLIFNTRNGAIIAIPGAFSADIETLLAGAPQDAVEPSIWQALAQNGFMVDDSTDEVELVLDRVAMGIADQNRLDVFVLPNMNCNFECPYCYEEHRPSQMPQDVADRIVAWFEKSAPHFKVVLVSWFGGEPMLSYARLLELQLRIGQICSQAGTALNSHITTNGYLLSPDRAASLVAAGVRSYQVTVDGPPDIHNRSRILRGDRDSFDRIFSNLCSLAECHPDTNIKLRVNFDPETLGRVPELLEMFPAHIRPRLHLVLERIFGQGQLFIGKGPQQIARDTEKMYALARLLGFAVTTTPLEPGRLTYCYADRENQVLFTHTGDVFKCTVSDFDSSDRLGYLEPDGAITWEGDGYRDWMGVPVIDQECRTCTYLPMCMGGCRKNRYHRGHASEDCTLPFAALDVRVQQRYESMIKETTSWSPSPNIPQPRFP